MIINLNHPRILCLSLVLLLNACASLSFTPPESTIRQASQASNKLSIGPYASFSGRLIVFDPSRRWQVSIDWQATQANTGKIRLTHALSGTVVDFRWTDNHMQVRDDKVPYWRSIQQTELTELGIVLPPSQLASILLNQTPAHFHQIKSDTWESMNSGSPIRLRWQEKLRTLTIKDVKQHRTARLIIKSHVDLSRTR